MQLAFKNNREFYLNNFPRPIKMASHINPLIRKNKNPAVPIRFSHSLNFSFIILRYIMGKNNFAIKLKNYIHIFNLKHFL